MIANQRKGVLIDHTLLDVIVAEGKTRKVVDRPWLTAAVDMPTGYVIGTQLSLKPPSDLPGSKSAEFSQGIEEKFGPVVSYDRVKRNPQYCGCVERFFQTMNSELIHTLVSARKRNSKEMNPAESSAYTLQEMKELIYRYITDVYRPKNRE